MKQMQLLHNGGFTVEERTHYAEVILGNALQSIQSLIRACRSLGMAFSQPQSHHHAKVVDATEVLFPSAELLEAIQFLWTEEDAIQRVFLRQAEFSLLDSAPYFLDNIDRILAPGYDPTNQDVLRSRVPTVGIIETDFIVAARSPSVGRASSSRPSQMHFKFVDVGGQRGERRKWAHCFENVDSLLFIASLNEFDQTLAENRARNRLRESLDLFEGIIHLPWFTNAAIILFLNKSDLFRIKIQTVDLGTYFPAYVGGHSYEDALHFIKALFFARSRDTERAVYAHVTDATDTDGMRFVWKATRHIVMQNSLRHAGLL